MSYIPPPQPDRHGIADLLRLVDDVRAPACDRTLTPDGAMRRLRDRLAEQAGIFDGGDEFRDTGRARPAVEFGLDGDEQERTWTSCPGYTRWVPQRS